MSRTRRTAPVEGFWTTVDEWAAGVVEPSPVRAWRRTRCRLMAASGPYLDVTGDVSGLEVPKPLGRAVSARGVALPDEPAVRSLLVDADIPHCVVQRAARYRWNGPAFAPVVLEAHSTEDEAVVETWWENVWAAWPQLSGRQRAPRRIRAVAEVQHLFDALGVDPLRRRHDD